MELKGIIFDVDGTLADTEEFHRLAFNKTFKGFGLEWHWSEDDYRDLLLISGGKERCMACLEKDQALKARIDKPQDFISDIHRCKSEYYRDMLIEGDIQLRPGIRRIIHEALKKNISLGIATSSSGANLHTLIKKTLNIDPNQIFNTIITSDIVTDKKPCPSVYQRALSGMGLDAGCCIAIEDTAVGNQAAQSSGLQTVITTHAYTNDDDFTGARLVVNHLGDHGNPNTVSQGDAHGKDLVDIELLQSFIAPDQAAGQTDHLNNSFSQRVKTHNSHHL